MAEGSASANDMAAPTSAAEGVSASPPPQDESAAAGPAPPPAEQEAEAAAAAAAAAAASSEETTGPPASEEELIARAEACKQRGNQLYADGLHLEAVEQYWAAVDACPEAAAAQRAVYHANLAAAYLKLERWPEAQEQCSCALRLEPQYQKALQRRAAACEKLDNLDQALADAKKVLELDPGSAWAQESVRRWEPVVQQRQEKMKEEVLGKLKDLGNNLLGRFGLSLDNFKADKDPQTGSYSIRFQQ